MIAKSGGAPGRFVELEGAVDLAVEIVSDGSEQQDTDRLPKAYFKAGIPAFWSIDARSDPIVFRIHDRGQSRGEPVATGHDSFPPSKVLGVSSRLDRHRDAGRHWRFDLHDRLSG